MKRAIILFLFALSMQVAIYAQNDNNASERLLSIVENLEQSMYNESDLLEMDKVAAEAKATYHQIASPSVDDTKAYNIILSAIVLSKIVKGDPDEVKKTTDEALTMIDEAKDLDPLTKADLFSSWTVFLQNIGEEHRAREILNKTLELYAENGEDTDEYANSLCSFAMLAYMDGSTELAETFCKRALDMKGRLHGNDVNPFAHGEYMMMATIKTRHKDYAAGLEYINKAIESLKSFGTAWDSLASDYATLQLSLYKKLGRYDDISASAEKVVNELISNTKNSLARLNSYQRANFVDKNNGFFTSTVPYYASIIDNPRLKDVAYNSVLFIKGLLLNADIEIEKVIRQSGDASLAQQHANISRLNHEIAQYKLTEENAPTINKLNEQLRQQETSLMQALRQRGIDPAANLSTDWTSVRDALKKDEAAIEFVVFRKNNISRTFGALVLKPMCEHPTYVELYTSQDFTSPEKEKEEEQYPYHIWETLGTVLKDVKTVYFSPIAELHKIPIEHINTDGLGKKFIRVSSTRQLALSHQSAGRWLVAFGGIDYDSENTALASIDDSVAIYRDAPIFERGQATSLKELPGTFTEALMLVTIVNGTKVKGRFKGIRAELESGANATESYFKMLSGKGVRIMHIGTHGFYSTAENSGEQESEQTAMRKCGLFFAGANQKMRQKSNYGDDGVLTASEISTLDFSGMDLVTLSACQSALGDISHDGVFGLQRGFKKAGVETLLMSLWKVDDKATTLLMNHFYDNLIFGKKTKYEALEEAKKSVRSHSEYQDPKYWAAFILLDAFD